MNYPEIRIKSSFLLNGKVVPLLLPELIHTNRVDEAKDEFIVNKVKEYSNEWAKYETRIIAAICELLAVEYKQNIIDAYVAPFNNSFSDPMVISTKYSASRFVDIFTHELIHRLLTDNTKLPLKDHAKLLPIWKDLFGQEKNFVTTVHIPVHAVLKYIFLDVLGEPDRFARDVDFSGRSVDYDNAWKYVNHNDYLKIIEQVKSVYI